MGLGSPICIRRLRRGSCGASAVCRVARTTFEVGNGYVRQGEASGKKLNRQRENEGHKVDQPWWNARFFSGGVRVVDCCKRSQGFLRESQLESVFGIFKKSQVAVMSGNQSKTFKEEVESASKVLWSTLDKDSGRGNLCGTIFSPPIDRFASLGIRFTRRDRALLKLCCRLPEAQLLFALLIVCIEVGLLTLFLVGFFFTFKSFAFLAGRPNAFPSPVFVSPIGMKELV